MARVFVITGPSGVGKGTLIRGLMQQVPELELSVSATTRRPRPGEVDGVDYHFLSDAEFQRRVDAGEFVEHATYSGRRYGTLRSELDRRTAAGTPVVLEIEVQGARQIREAMPEAVQIFIAPPSDEALRTRLIGRGTDDAEQVERRLATARRELEAKDEFPHVVVNDRLDDAARDLDRGQVLERIRQVTDVPLLIVSARDHELEKVRALRAGADDYVTKPFALEELLARVEALSRRPQTIAAPVLHVADLELDKATRRVTRAGEPIDLTPKEYSVLEYLMRHAGRVMSRTLITEYAWDYHFDPGTNIVDVVINHLRKKVDAKHDKKLISTVRGVGYVIRG